MAIMVCSQGFAKAGDNTEPNTDPNTTPKKSEHLVLRKIMQDMSKNMQVITDAISREDWKLIEKTAPLIADHPQPPLSEKVRIMAFAGTNMGAFKSFDGKTHKAASVLGETATQEDGVAVIKDFATLQNTCLMCHQSFRKPFQKHFYVQPSQP